MKLIALLAAMFTCTAGVGFSQGADYENQLPSPPDLAKQKAEEAEKLMESQQDQVARQLLGPLGNNPVTIRGRVLSVIGNNAAILVDCPRDYSEKPSGPPKCYSDGEARQIPTRDVPREIIGTVLLRLPPGFPQLADDDPVILVAGQVAGVYHYAAADGSSKTVRVYWLGTNTLR